MRIWSILCRTGLILLALVLVRPSVAEAQVAGPPASKPAGTELQVAVEETRRSFQLGPGDVLTFSVFGQPDMTTTTFVGDDGTLKVPLAGAVAVGGLSPAEASQRIEKALQDGNYLVNPKVTISSVQSKSQRVSVLGEVAKPGRYTIDSKMSVYDLLAESGGVTANGSDKIFLLRADKDGNVARYELDLKGLSMGTGSVSTQELRGGDSIFVPHAEQFYIYGEVLTPGRFRVDPGMTVLEAIARAGGVSIRGSQRRVEIKRPQPDGTYVTSKAALSDPVRPDDVIRVKESIF